mmetsp:Transcript_107606/g.304204  ORF Transcript_107606/g.304204 Transcript_107606/m.304204 type:complete len:797 (+) Transcript_107606:79-2469(+)
MVRLHAIRTACELPPEARTDDHIDDILNFVKDVAFFSKLNELQQHGLCRAMTLEVFNRGDNVFEMGQPGEKFYIILTGGVGVQLPLGNACPNGLHSPENCNCPNQQFETAVFLEKGMGFGELALQSDQPRSATISASEWTELLVTKRADYEKYAGELHRQFIEQRVKFLRRCPRIEDALKCGLISPQDIAAMANCLCEASLSGNALVCRQGDLVDRMIFVRSGQLLMLRAIDMEPGHVECPTPSAAREPAEAPKTPEHRPGTGARGDFSMNFAKAMMDIKKKERQTKLHEMTGDDAAAGQKTFKRTRSKPLRRDSTAGSKLGEGPDRGSSKPSEGADRAPNAPVSPKWTSIRNAVKHATILNEFCTGEEKRPAAAEKDPAQGLAEAQHSIAHFHSVAQARRRVTDIEVKHMKLLSQTPRTFRRASGSSAALPARRRRRHLLRMGSIGPYQYYGDQQLCTSESYPVSLVSDPVAEIYVMSKSDILRRLPKKILATLFTLEQDVVPSDTQLLEMHKQTKRWDAFCRGMKAESSERNSSSRVDVVGNLAFLGIRAADGATKGITTPLPQTRSVVLTHREEKHFSDASARFLRRFGAIKRDPALRNALARDGLIHQQVHESLLDDGRDDDKDPMAFRLEQYWSKLSRDPIGLDLDDALSMDETLRDDMIGFGDISSTPGDAAGGGAPAGAGTGRLSADQIARFAVAMAALMQSGVDGEEDGEGGATRRRFVEAAGACVAARAAELPDSGRLLVAAQLRPAGCLEHFSRRAELLAALQRPGQRRGRSRSQSRGRKKKKRRR